MQTEFSDRLLVCVDCCDSFIFTVSEQLFFLDKQFRNDPKRCKPCKAKRAARPAAASGSDAASPGKPASAGLARQETRTHCSECHIETTVPFRPSQGRPVLCRLCFQARSKTVGNPLKAAQAVLSGALPAEFPNAADAQPQTNS